MERKGLTLGAPHTEASARRRQSNAVSMIYLGDAKHLWDAHQKVCGRSHEDFARHLLILHKAYCSNYCEAESLKEKVLKALQTERKSTTHKETRHLDQSTASHKLNDLELKVKQEPVEIVEPIVKTPRLSSKTSNACATVTKDHGTEAILDAQGPAEEPLVPPGSSGLHASNMDYSLLRDKSQSEPDMESCPPPIISHTISLSKVGDPWAETVTLLSDAGLYTSPVEVVANQGGEDLHSPPVSGQHQPTDDMYSLLDNLSVRELYWQSDTDLQPFADDSVSPPHIPEHQYAKRWWLQPNISDLEPVPLKKDGEPQLPVTPVSLYTNTGLVAPAHHRSHSASGCLTPLSHLTIKTKQSAGATVGQPPSENDLHIMDINAEMMDSSDKSLDEGGDEGLSDSGSDVRDTEGTQRVDNTQLLSHMVNLQEAIKQPTVDVTQSMEQALIFPENDIATKIDSYLRTVITQDPSKSNSGRVFLRILKKQKPPTTDVLQKTKEQKPHTSDVLQKAKVKQCVSQDTAVVLKRFRKIAPRLNAHVGNSQHICSVCDKGFDDLCSLESHMNTHTADTTCTLQDMDVRPCVVPDAHRADRDDVLRIVDMKPCTVSDSVLSDSVLQDSVLSDSHISAGPGECACYHCGKEFVLFAELQAHMEDHADPTYTCYKCGQGPFSDLQGLQLHLDVHRKDLTCHRCGKEFSTMSDLLMHLEWHAVQLPNTCCECSKVLASKQSLLVHMKQHTGHKPHICVECKKGFSTKHILKLHMLTHTGVKDHVCSDCGKGFSELGGLKKHMRTHTEDRPYMCTVCDVGFKERCALKKHKIVHTEDKPYKCADCGKAFGRMDGLKIHLTTHTGEKSCLCSKCGKAFTRTSTLMKHMMIHTGHKPHACSECGKRFRLASNLKDHMKTHTGEKPHICADCGKRFSQKGKLTIHMRKHTGEKPYKCPDCGRGFIASSIRISHMRIHARQKHLCAACGKAFSLLGHLKKHLMTHAGEKPNMCSDCGHAFSDTGKLTEHMRVHKKEMHICSVCGKEFKKLSYLNRHMFTHTGESPHCCMECGKAFRRLNDLKKHTMKHTGEKLPKPHLCTHCGKGFDKNYSLKIHMRTHTGEKPHACSYCGKGFGLLTILKTHIRTHTGERPHVCFCCGKGFISSSNLKRHMVSHTGEKRYVCSDCPKAFGGVTDLRKHKMIHTGEKPFQCSYCTYASNRKSNLNKHVKIHTGESTGLTHIYS